jgi:rhodanese-related sulfurtransferase
MKRVLPFVCIMALTCSPVSAFALDWTSLEKKIKRKFDDVPHINSATAAKWLETKPGIVVLDVRDTEEFAVSHLENARIFPPGSRPQTLSVPKDTPIITYCSVGWRSAEMARKLRKAGFTNVHTLMGSIFQWANEARPVYTGKAKTPYVHPYNRRWGTLLDKKYHVPK